MTTLRLLPALVFSLPLVAAAETRAINPRIREIVDSVSEARIEANVRKLQSFGTRNTMSAGIAAAREWIAAEFRGYSPRLQVGLDRYRVKKTGERIFRDVDLYNVVAVLPGAVSPQTRILVAAHYDSLNLVPLPGSSPADATASVGDAGGRYDWQQADVAAPGADDDASGVAAVMELARVMSRYQFDKTLVFVAFAGEEQGLVGATLEASRARRGSQDVEAMLNNDIIGSATTGDGRTNDSAVNVYGGWVTDSPSQALARYAREIGGRYVPSIEVNPVYQEDRFARGGDHTPFQLEGYAAIRFSSPNENFEHQHTSTDTLEHMSVPCAARVARVNGAVAASLALAPRPPVVMAEAKSGSLKGRPVPTISRGKSKYDAVLRWKSDPHEPDLAGYVVVMRPTTAPYWEREIAVGNVNEFTLRGVSIDDVRFGVKAVDKDGNESLVSPYLFPPREKVVYETE